MIRWFLRGVTRPPTDDPLPARRGEPAPPRFRARALLDPTAVDPRQRGRVRGGLPAGALTPRRARTAAPRRGPLHRAAGCASRPVEDGVADDRPGYELASRSRARLIVGDRAEKTDVRAASLGGPFRRSLHIRHVDTGSDGAVEQEIAALLNPYYDMQRLGSVLHRRPAPRRRPAGHRARHRPDGGSRCAGPTRRCPNRGSWSPPAPTRAAAASGPSPRCSAASTGCCRSTSTSPAIRRARSRCCTDCCSPPGARERSRRRARTPAARVRERERRPG